VTGWPQGHRSSWAMRRGHARTDAPEQSHPDRSEGDMP
jgi:hypothetical protein